MMGYIILVFMLALLGGGLYLLFRRKSSWMVRGIGLVNAMVWFWAIYEFLRYAK